MCTDVPGLPQKKMAGEETTSLLLIFSEGGDVCTWANTSVARFVFDQQYHDGE